MDSASSWEIRTDGDGALDEVVASGIQHFHLERMDEGFWWMALNFNDGTEITVHLTTARPSRTKIEGMAEACRGAGKRDGSEHG